MQGYFAVDSAGLRTRDYDVPYGTEPAAQLTLVHHDELGRG